jgi:hypothetical protein
MCAPQKRCGVAASYHARAGHTHLRGRPLRPLLAGRPGFKEQALTQVRSIARRRPAVAHSSPRPRH